MSLAEISSASGLAGQEVVFMDKKDPVQCTGVPIGSRNNCHLDHFQNHLVNSSSLGSVQQVHQSGLEQAKLSSVSQRFYTAIQQKAAMVSFGAIYSV